MQVAGGLGGVLAIMPRSLLSVPRYSDFWELAGGGRGASGGWVGRKGGEEKRGKRGVRGKGRRRG